MKFSVHVFTGQKKNMSDPFLRRYLRFINIVMCLMFVFLDQCRLINSSQLMFGCRVCFAGRAAWSPHLPLDAWRRSWWCGWPLQVRASPETAQPVDPKTYSTQVHICKSHCKHAVSSTMAVVHLKEKNGLDVSMRTSVLTHFGKQ